MFPRVVKAKVACAICSLMCGIGSGWAQTLFIDPVGIGTGVTLTGGGGPLSSTVEIFRNGVSLGSATTTPNGRFALPGLSINAGDTFQAAASQVWNFNQNGNAEGWVGLVGDASVVVSGVWSQTNLVSSDMQLSLYGDGKVLNRARVLELRLRFQGSGARTASVIIQTAGTNGVAGGGDDLQSTILNTATLVPSAAFQTFLFDLGLDHDGVPTCWNTGGPPISITLYIGGAALGDHVHVDYIRLTESLTWDFDSPADVAEWQANPSSLLIATNSGSIRLQGTSAGNVAMSRPFRNIDSRHFVRLESRMRQVTGNQPNLFAWNYFSKPAGYAMGGMQLQIPANGSFHNISMALTNPPTYGSAWTNGGAATLNFPQEAFTAFYAVAPGEFAEIDYVALRPSFAYGPSLVVTSSAALPPPVYYISHSSGSDLNTGRDPAQAWKTFANLDGFTLGPGTVVLLKRGDLWSKQTLRLSGKGAASAPVLLSAYGEGPNPQITGVNLTNAPCIQWNNPSYVKIENMDCRDAKVGLYLRFAGGNVDGTGDMFRNTDVTVAGCHFQNMDAVWSEANGNITVQPPYELSWGAGIWVGGSIPSPPGGPWPSETTPILDNLTISHCGFRDVSTGLGMNFYYPSIYKSRFRNLRFEDSWVTGCENGSFAIFFVDGGHAKRVDTWIGGSGFYATGTTAGFAQSSKNFRIEDCEFAGNKRNNTGNDGTGFDFEGDCENMTFANCVLHDNDGGALLVLDSQGDNTALAMVSGTVWNNCRNPASSGQNFEFRYPNTGSSGSLSNFGVYRGSANSSGSVGLYDSATRWSQFSPVNIRSGTAWSAVNMRPLAWEFVNSVEGWSGVNQWNGFGTSGGALVGTSAGVDPYAESAPTWVNTRERRWVRVRMSQTAGYYGQIFFQLETDQTWTPSKSVFFPIIADGTMRDYAVDMGFSTNYMGVVTRFRLDPTDSAGSSMAIDLFATEANPQIVSVSALSPQILDVRISNPMDPDGGVFSTANFTLGGSGRGTLATQPSTVSLIPAAEGPIYRLAWSQGSMTASPATLTLSNARDARGSTPPVGRFFTFLNQTATPQSDLVVTISNVPGVATLGSNVTSTIVISNLGPDTAESVLLTVTMSSGTAVRSINAGTAQVSTNGSTLSLAFASLGADSTATVQILFSSSVVGSATFNASVTSAASDPVSTNNVSAASHFIEPVPYLTISTVDTTTVEVSWSAMLSNWTLEASSDLPSFLSWTSVPIAPDYASGNLVVRTNATSNVFYRLTKPQ